MDVFDVTDATAAFFRDAALAAAHDLGVFTHRPAQPTRRMRQLLDLLAAFGIDDAPAARPAVPPGGWGDLADVIRRDRPLPANDAETTRRLHAHLASAGAAAAAEVAALLPEGHLVDLGGGAGAYSAAYLDRTPTNRTTLVDVPDVIAIARDHLARFEQRVDFIASDILDVTMPRASVALLANVLHLHGPETCAEICRVAARCSDVVAIKDLRMDEGRRRPLSSLVFAMNMGLYTDAGDVYETSQVRAWLADAGLADIAEHRLATSPDSIVVVGRRR